jgi:hypothetical protein
LPAGAKVENVPRKKLFLVYLFLAAFSLAVSTALRFVPSANDFISGRPQPTRRFATMMAEGLATSLKNSPVLLVPETRPDCARPDITKHFKGDRLYITMRYSENPLMLYETLYGNATPSSDPREIITLTESSGTNYGAKITTPAKVVAVGYSFVRFPDDLSRVLDWRQKEDPFYTLEGKLRVEESFPNGVSLSLKTVEQQPILGFRDLVAARHNTLNAILLWCIGFFALALLPPAAGVWTQLVSPRRSFEVLPKPSALTRGEGWQRKKRAIIFVASLDLVLMTLLVLVRNTPSLTESISGPVHSVRALTRKFAQLTAQTEGPQFPVILMEGEDNDCSPIRTAKVTPQPNAIYYVLSYSEKLSLSCWTAYVTPFNGVTPPGTDWVTISGDQGTNYGRQLHGAVRAVPFDRSVKLYNPQYLGLLHWRTDPNIVIPDGFIAAKNFPPGNRPFDLQEPEFFNTKVGLAELRSEVARNQNRLELLLLDGIGLSLLVLVTVCGRAWLLSWAFSSRCRELGFPVKLPLFLAENWDALLEGAKQAHQRQREESLEEARRDNVVRRSRDEIGQKLQGLLPTLPEQSQQQIRQCLSPDRNSSVEEMAALWQELRSQSHESTPVARLNLLLDSSKEYCSEEEFERAWAEAFAILEYSGFREAREFAVKLHNDLRARAKTMEQIEKEDAREQGR